MTRLSDLFLPGRPKKSGSTSDKKQTNRPETARAVTKGDKSPTVERQMGLETHRRRAHTRHRTDSGELVPMVRGSSRVNMLENKVGSCSSDEVIRAYLDDSTASIVTVSANPDPRMCNDYVIRLSALLPGVDRPRFLKGRLDHGSCDSLISTKLVDFLNLPVEEVEPVNLRGLSRCSETTSKRTKLSFRIYPWLRVFRVDFWVVEEQCMSNDILLGRKFLERDLLFETNKLWRYTTAPPKKVEASEPWGMGAQNPEIVLCSPPVGKPIRGQ